MQNRLNPMHLARPAIIEALRGHLPADAGLLVQPTAKLRCLLAYVLSSDEDKRDLRGPTFIGHAGSAYKAPQRMHGISFDYTRDGEITVEIIKSIPVKHD